MASGLHTLQASISRNLLRCLPSSCDLPITSLTKWRCMASLALEPQAFETEVAPCPVTPLTLGDLKMKETGDWRKLSLEEKQTLYRMSFSQPLHYAVDHPADEWKLILASTFTAMGFMLLGIYFMETRSANSESDIGPLSSKNKDVRFSFGDKVEVAA